MALDVPGAGILGSTMALLLACCVSACTAASSELTAEEASVAASAGIDAALVARVKPPGGPIERLMAFTPDHEAAPGPGIVISAPRNDGRATLEKLRSDLAATDHRAYLREDGFGRSPDKIAIVRTDDLGYLAIVRTDGINYDLEHADVVARYREWDEKYGLELVGAGRDWIEATFKRPPSDWTAFAAEVNAFCPDVVEQGTGDVVALASELRAGSVLYLWWD